MKVLKKIIRIIYSIVSFLLGVGFIYLFITTLQDPRFAAVVDFLFFILKALGVIVGVFLIIYLGLWAWSKEEDNIDSINKKLKKRN